MADNRMENNRYAKHRKEILEISQKEDVDLGVACAILRHEKGWLDEIDGFDTELTDFCRHVRKMETEERKAFWAE